MNASTAIPDRLRRSSRDREMITPEGIALPVTLASRGARAGALIVDLIIIVTLQIITTILLAMLAFGGIAALLEQGNAGSFGSLEFLWVIWLIAMFLFRNAYFLFFELGPRGATPGKRLAGIRIASRDGGRLSVEAVIARNLLRDIELFLPVSFISLAQDGEGGAVALAALAWFLVFALFPFWNRDRLRAGDIVAGTWVVERPRQRLESMMSVSATAGGHEKPTPRPAYVFSDAELDVYGEYELQTLERVLRDGRPESLSAVHKAIARKIGRQGEERDDRAFLDAYYTQLRARLEANMRMGQRKADKYG